MQNLEALTVFATLIGLICNFKSINDSKKQDEFNNFIKYISEKNHNEIINKIENNIELHNSLKSLLSLNHDEVLKKLSAVESALLNFSSKISGLKEISESLNKNFGLSEQAYSIISQLESSNGSSFLKINSMDVGNSYLIMDGNKGEIIISESRFIEDDLNILVNLGLLRLSLNNSNERLFCITRQASNLVQSNK